MQRYWPGKGNSWASAVLVVTVCTVQPGGGTAWAQEPQQSQSGEWRASATDEYQVVEGSAWADAVQGNCACADCVSHLHDYYSCKCADCVTRLYSDYPTIGMQRVPFALFEIDAARPTNVFRIRFDAAYDHEKPDRAEYFWAKIHGRGPRPVDPAGNEIGERSVDYQDFRLYLERGTERASAFTEIPVRVLDPEDAENTAGLADINLGTKNILFEGEQYQLSSIFRTYIPSGLARRGLGTGHVSMELGILGNYELWDYTYLHGQFKFWFPIGGDSDVSGEVLQYGVGWSHVWWENPSENCAFISSLELVGWSVLDGLETPSGMGAGGMAPDPVEIDPEGILNFQPGLRLVMGQTFEFGISMAFAVTQNHWYEELIRLDFRWFF